MTRIAGTLCALAVLWSSGATLYLLLGSTPGGIARSALWAPVAEGVGRIPPLDSAPGVWMAGLLVALTLLTALPAGVARGHPPGLRATAWTAAGLLFGVCLLAGAAVGLLYLPSALLLVAAGGMGARTPHSR